jgi:hypothetical protein
MALEHHHQSSFFNIADWTLGERKPISQPNRRSLLRFSRIKHEAITVFVLIKTETIKNMPTLLPYGLIVAPTGDGSFGPACIESRPQCFMCGCKMHAWKLHFDATLRDEK